MALCTLKKLSLIIVFITIFLMLTIHAQQRYREKPGACPPPTPINICNSACQSDGDCKDIGKCCPTSCGGNVCTRPVTDRKVKFEKSGNCPEIPTGRWVCTSMCSSDSECTGKKKCCQNRCGAFTCQKPESIDTPNIQDIFV